MLGNLDNKTAAERSAAALFSSLRVAGIAVTLLSTNLC